MTEILKPDICVIGAGSGGLTVAATAAAFGVSTVLIEKGEMGGDCLNYGCVPSKALIAAGKLAIIPEKSDAFGVHLEPAKVNFRKVSAHVKSVIAAIAPNDSEERFTGMGIKVIRAAGCFKDAKTVTAGEYEIQARRFVIATGSSPFVPPIPGLDGVPYFTNETIFDNTRQLNHLIVIGGGPIGMELAQAHRRLGPEVTVIEMFAPLGKDDPEAAAIVLNQIAKEGIDIRAGVKVVGVAGRAGNIRVTVEDGDGAQSEIRGSHLLVAAGRLANIAELGLEEAGIKSDRRGIIVNKGLKSSNRRVYAIGDVARSLQFTHMANYHAGLVIRNALFRMPVKEDISAIPWVTYTDPELAHVGLDENASREKHRNIRVLRWPYVENDRAQAERTTDGFIKVITTTRGKILGATIVGQSAGEIIQMWALAIDQGLKIKAMTSFVSPYPTLTEISKRAAITYYASSLSNPWIQRAIRFLRLFG